MIEDRADNRAGSRRARRGAGEVSLAGVDALRKGERQAAYELFREAVRAYPRSSELWVWLGAAAPSLDEAQKAFEQAYELNPNNAEASLGVRWVRLRRKAALDSLIAVPVPLQVTRPDADVSRETPAEVEPPSAFSTSPLVPIEDDSAPAPPRQGWPALWAALTGQEDLSNLSKTLAALVPVGLLTLIAVIGMMLATLSPPGRAALMRAAEPTPFMQVAGLEGGDRIAEETPGAGPARPAVAPTRAPTRTATRTSTPSPSPTGTPTPSPSSTATSTPLPTDTPVPAPTPVPPPPVVEPPPPAPPPPAVTRYVVRRGDTLGAIAYRFGTTVGAIRQANGLASDRIDVGQVLVIPPR